MFAKNNILILIFSLIFILFSYTKVSSQEIDYKAYTLFVYNFIKYIEWPESELGQEFIIGVVGNTPIISELQMLATNKKAHDRPIVIKKFSSVEEIDRCHLLYISPSKSGLLKDVLTKTKDLPTLIVAEREGLAKKGAAINFVTLEEENDLLKFEVNKKSLEARNLKIPTVLLKLGFIVG